MDKAVEELSKLTPEVAKGAPATIGVSAHAPDAFSFVLNGSIGGTIVSPLAHRNNVMVGDDTLPVGLPPTYTLESKNMKTVVAQRYLLNMNSLGIHKPEIGQVAWAREVQPLSLLHVTPTDPLSSIIVQRDPLTLAPVSFREQSIHNRSTTSANSMALDRRSARHADAVFGSNTNMPFRPGGMDERDTSAALPSSAAAAESDAADEWINFSGPLKTQAPGLPHGVEFPVADGLDGISIDISDAILGGPAASADAPAPTAGTVLSIADVLNLMEEDIVDDEEQAAAAIASAAAAVAPSEETAIETALERTPAVSRQASAAAASGNEKSGVEGKTSWAIVIPSTLPVSKDEFNWKVPDPAYRWPFELDDFQKHAIMQLEQHNSVFIAAHTSAGKTVVAEYAIALAARHMTRCVYTSPIKALSNQKFRDFRETFKDVGLLTGDVQINPEASCLIMTTEILRSMLYRGADLIRDIEWVIFDEVHYVNDAERGVVWEEVIIMLPKHVNIIMLSATVPNTFEFADWVGRTKRKNMYVISTMKRPVPLQHFLYTGSDAKTSEEMFLLMESNQPFNNIAHRKAVEAKKARASANKQEYGARNRTEGGPGSDRTLYVALVNMLKKKELTPCVIFTFSKKRCEANADALYSLDLNSATEKSQVQVFFAQSVARLKGSDQSLPQVKRMREMLSKGVGVHHSGLLPIIKEMVEMMFAKGLVKVLFATETFAMGVNMPARCVVFDSIRKHDGEAFRDLLPGEYIQMAGRAGRRGLDKNGTVIVLCKGDVPEISDLEKMMRGVPTKLTSQFRLTYNMILNLLRVEELRVEDMMRRSFSEAVTQKDASQNRDILTQSKAKLDTLTEVNCEYCVDIDEYYKLSVEYLTLSHNIQKAILASPQAIKALVTGRVVVINNAAYRNALAVVLRQEMSRTSNDSSKKFTVFVIREERAGTMEADAAPRPVTRVNLPAGKLAFDVVVVDGMDIITIADMKLKVNILQTLDRPDTHVQSMLAQDLLRFGETCPNGPVPLNPIKEFKLNDLDFVEAFQRWSSVLAHLQSFQCTHCPTFTQHYGTVHSRHALDAKVKELQFLLSDQSLTLLPEYHQRMDVLHALRYIDETNTVQLKGRVACEITTCDSIIITELVFENILTPLEPAEIVALLSAMVFQEKSQAQIKLTKNLEAGVNAMTSVATRIAETQVACGLAIPVDVYVKTMNFGLVEVVHEWACGTPFSEITNLTDVLEGSIVRCITRLDETCRDVRNAARVIGDPVLFQKMDQASQMIKRDIVFAASLYTV